jgi:hypothetical protein
MTRVTIAFSKIKESGSLLILVPFCCFRFLVRVSGAKIYVVGAHYV